jgi:hypothetical protein
MSSQYCNKANIRVPNNIITDKNILVIAVNATVKIALIVVTAKIANEPISVITIAVIANIELIIILETL